MNDSAKDRTPDNVLMDLDQFLSGGLVDVDGLTDEEVTEELVERKIDSQQMFSNVTEQLEDAIMEAKLAEARQLREDKLASKSQRPSLLSIGRDKIVEFLNGQSPAVATGYFSKLESCEDEDLESMVEDLYDLGLADFLENDEQIDK